MPVQWYGGTGDLEKMVPREKSLACQDQDDVRILQPTSLPRERFDPWELQRGGLVGA